MSANNRGLGRGLDSLIPTDMNVDDLSLVDATDRIMRVPVGQIRANPQQPRHDFDEAELISLSESIREHGILQPLLVTDEGSGSYILVAGERRWRAAQKVGQDTVPVIIITADDVRRAEVALIENVQREDLKPLELANALYKLHNEFNLDYEEIGRRVGKASTTVVNIVRLMQLPDAAKKALTDGEISEGHARAVLALRDFPDKQAELLKYIVDKGWSVRKAEQFVVAVKQGGGGTTKAVRSTSLTTAETMRLSKQLGSKVTLRRLAKGGQLQINYKDDQDLSRLIDNLSQNKPV